MEFPIRTGMTWDAMKTPPIVFGWIAAGFLLTGSLHSQEAEKNGNWTPEKIEGIDYVPVGEIKAFYGFEKMEREGADARFSSSKVEMILTPGSQAVQFNRIKIILGQKVLERDGNLFIARADLSRFIDPILRPDQIAQSGNFNTVILDPGAGWDAGAPDEASARHSLAIMEQVKTELEKQGLRVLLTRADDKIPSRESVVELANGVGEPAIFVGITFEGRKDQPRGTRASVMFSPAAERTADEDGFSRASVALGVGLHGAILKSLGTNTVDNGLAEDAASALAGIHHPRVLITAANLADPYEVRLAEDGRFQKAVAQGISSGVMKYRFVVRRKVE